MMGRRDFLLSAAALSTGLAACSDNRPRLATRQHVKLMAITMDDFNQNFDIGLSLEERHQNILEAFEAVGHKAAGFVTGSFVDTEWGGSVIRHWLKSGHAICNHTWTHPHANELELTAFLTDVSRNRSHLLAFPGTSNFFRFPFLDDGRDRAHQVKIFEGLEALELRNAPVTIDTIDWYTASRFEAKLRADPQTDLAPYRDYYVEMCVTLANYWDGVAQMLGFRSLPHQTLMHHNVLNGHFLRDVLLALKADGWQFVDASVAMNFDLYDDLPPEPTQGRSWLTLQSLKAGLEAPPFPEAYVQFGKARMDSLGL